VSRPVLDHRFQRLTSDIAHRCLVLEVGHVKGAPDTYQEFVQSSDIGTVDPDDGDRHQTSPIKGEIGHRWSERYSGPRKVNPRIILN